MNDDNLWDADEQDMEETDEVSEKELEQLYLGALGAIAGNNDPRNKEIGDRVIIWDHSYSFNTDTGNRVHFTDWPGIQEAIVSEVNCTRVYDGRVCDLLVIFPPGQSVAVPSNHVRRTDTCTK